MRIHQSAVTVCFLMMVPAALAAVEGAESYWHGFRRTDFNAEGRSSYIVYPDAPAPGNPWVWRARFPGYHPEIDISLVGLGFHLLYTDVGGLYGSPQAVAHWDAFYDYAVKEFNLSPRVTLEGVSRGGLIIYNWAKKNPHKIDCIYTESPVCDFKSWPGGKGFGIGSPDDWKQLLEVYGLDEPSALEYKDNPIDNLQPLAKAGVPLLHVICENDRVVPPNENTAILQRRYQELGGEITVLDNQSEPQTLHGHHFPLDDVQRIVEFVLEHTPKSEAALAHLQAERATPFPRDYFRLRRGLSNSQRKFSRGQSGRVAFLGGSITHNSGWRDQVCDDLQKRFPNTAFEFINAGIPSMGSTPGAFRLQRDVLSKGPIDLLFVEAAVNDSTNGRTAIEQIRAMEGIIRHAQSANPDIDIVVMYFADPEKIGAIDRGGRPEVITNHETVAEYYDIPSLNLALEVSERILAREFTWKDDFVDLHPSPFGQELYSRSIARLLDEAWSESAISPEIHKYSLPEIPLDEKNYAHGRLAGIEQVEISKGWQHIDSWHPADKAGTRHGFVDVPMLCADEPDAELHFQFHGKAVGIFVAAGPDAGIVEYSIDGTPFQERDLFTQWSRGLHLPWAYVLATDLDSGSHELVLRISAHKNEKSRGHAVRIAHFLVNGPEK